MNLKEEKGYTMVVVMVTVVILSIMITAVTTLALSDVRKSKLWRDKTAAFYLAESGVNHVMSQIIEAKTEYENKNYLNDQPNVSSEGIYDFGPGNTFQVWVKEEGNKLTITSKGIANKIPKVIEVSLLSSGEKVFPIPAAGHIIETEAEHNQKPGYYDPSYSIPEIKIIMPEGLTEGSLSLSNNKQRTISEDHFYSSIDLSNNVILTIEGPATINVSGSVLIGNGSTIIIKDNVQFIVKDNLKFENNSIVDYQNGKVNFFVGKNLYIENNSIIGKVDPTKLAIYLSTEADPGQYNVNIENNAVIFGGICAPKAKVTMDNNSELTGALIGWEVFLKNNSEVIYVNAMKDITLGGGGGDWTYEGWNEF